jgi:UDP-glucuronate 4-epimerase
MTTLVTGSAGFIGSALVDKLLNRGDTVIGIDNHNGYYDPLLKEARLKRHREHPGYTHVRGDIGDSDLVSRIFREAQPQVVVNLAAQAGVRYSLENPQAYISANVMGFMNILEACRHHAVEHLVYASTSSVYGANLSVPYSTRDSANHPLSLYAASKKANELMAHSYSHLFGIPTTGLRFFTVYGPWGRPDMAPFKFARAILNNEPIDVYNFGQHTRDFTYIDDIVDGVARVIDKPAKGNPNWSGYSPDSATSLAPWRIYNIGNSDPVLLTDFVHALEKALGKKADINLLPIQPGDVPDTFADLDDTARDFGFVPRVSVQAGVEEFVKWYLEYYHA